MTMLHQTIRTLLAGAVLTLPSVILSTAMSGEERGEKRAVSDPGVSHESGTPTETAPDEKRASDGIRSLRVSRVLYHPPRTGSPTPDHRIGGGTRGGSALPLIAAIAPDHEGLTARGQPELCWYLSLGDRDLRVIFTLIRSDAIRPLIEQRLASPAEPGIQVVRLSDHGIELDIGHSYEWSVSIVPDADHRSRDIVATGVIRRVSPHSFGVTQALPSSDPMRTVRVSAEAGLWYDAVVELADLMEAAPDDPGLRREWAGLLKQVNLSHPGLWSAEGL